MTDTVEGRVICDERASRCRCHRDAGHVESGDEVHECDPRRCSGAWRVVDGEFQIVRLPYPVGESEPWPDEDTDADTDWAPAPIRVRRGGIRFR